MIFLENIPIYVQIADDIKDQIIAGRLGGGDKLLSIREYSLKYEVTALTMQRALALLEGDGVVETKKGVGSFVRAGVRDRLKIRLVEELVRDFITRARNMGISPDEILQNVKEGLQND